MTIKFDDALRTLQEMFPHIPPQAVRNCLIQNSGHMENTVAVLLTSPPQAFSVPQPRIQPNRPRPAPPMMGNQPSLSNAAGPWGRAPRGLPQTNVQNRPPVRQQPAPPPAPRHNLSEDFLRPPSYFFSKYQVQQSQSMVDEDAILAKVLQDSLFMSQLRENPEWVLQQMQPPSSISNRKPSDSANPTSLKARIRGQGADGNMHRNDEQEKFASKFKKLGGKARERLTKIAAGLKRNKGAKYQTLDTPTNDVGNYKPPPG